MRRLLMGVLAAICLASLAQAQTQWYVDASAAGGDGESWNNAFTCIQDGITAATSGGEVWVRAGTYDEYEDNTAEITDSFEQPDIRSADAVDILGQELDLFYRVNPDDPDRLSSHITVLYPGCDPTMPPANALDNLESTDDTYAFGDRIADLADGSAVTGLMAFINHPSMTGSVVSETDIAAVANAGSITAMELVRRGLPDETAENMAKWDYALANLDDQTGACAKMIWGMCSDDEHSITRVGWENAGVMMGSIPTAASVSNRRTAFVTMMERGSIVALPPECKCGMPSYTLNSSGGGEASNLQVSVHVDNLWNANSAQIQFYGCDFETGTPGTLLYTTDPLSLNADNTVTYYLTQTGAANGTALTAEQKANIKYIRPVLKWAKTYEGPRYAYFQPVRIKTDEYKTIATWWVTQDEQHLPRSPYYAPNSCKVFFNTHTHTAANDGVQSPAAMRKRYWDKYEDVAGDDPRFAIITDHCTVTLFAPPTASVVTLKSGVSLYGGFAGSETERSERNWVDNHTIIDAGGAGRCVYAEGVTDAVLDGFTMMKGVAKNGSGGGMYLLESSPEVANCTFGDPDPDPEHRENGNKASFGAGVCITSGHPTFTNCRFTNNFVTKFVHDGKSTIYGGGGGIYTDFDLPNEATVISNCRFDGNWASGNPEVTGQACPPNAGGGAIACDSSSPKITNCLFEQNHANGNSSAGRGGGVCCRSSSAVITNCTLVGNEASVFHKGGGIYCDDWQIANQLPTIRNSIIANGDNGLYWYHGHDPMLNNNNVVNNGYDNVSHNYVEYTLVPVPGPPYWVWGDLVIDPPTSNISSDPHFVSTSDFHLLPNSPCIDTGTDTDAPDTDIDGWIRPQDGDGDSNHTAVCDMGAYEYPLSLMSAVFDYPEETSISFGDVSVTAKFSDPSRIYVEKTNKTCGIKVLTSAVLNVGDVVNVSGEINTETNGGERYVDESAVSPTGATNILGTLGMPNKWIGGSAPSGLSLWEASGLYNVGLLVNIWGAVTYVGSGFFYIDDGSGLHDGSGNAGIRVITPSGMSMPTVGQYRWLVGISGAEWISGHLARVVRLRSSQATDWGLVDEWDEECGFDISDGWNNLALSVIPRYRNPEVVFNAPLGEPAIELTGYLNRYDPIAQSVITYNFCDSPTFGNCLLGDCFMLNRDSGGDTFTRFDGTHPEWNAARWDQWMGLPRDGGIYLANPLGRDVLWSDCWFTDGKTVKSPHEAYVAGWITVDATGDFSTGDMHFLTTGDFDLALIVPDL